MKNVAFLRLFGHKLG